MEQETRNGAGTEDGGDRDRGWMGWDGTAWHVMLFTWAIILCLRTFSLSRILMATFSPVSTFLANLTLAKVPSPRVRPSSYRPTRVRPTDALIFRSVCLSLSPGSGLWNRRKRRRLCGSEEGLRGFCLPVRVAAEGLRPLLVAGSPLDEYLPVLLALLPLPHQASLSLCSLTGVSVRPLRAAAWDGDGMGWRPERQGREGNGGDGGGGSGW